MSVLEQGHQVETARQSVGYDPQSLPPSEKQLRYARTIAIKTKALLPWDVQQDRRKLSHWIDQHAAAATPAALASAPATSRQVAFAEQLARRKRTAVPDECYRSRALMSAWLKHTT